MEILQPVVYLFEDLSIGISTILAWCVFYVGKPLIALAAVIFWRKTRSVGALVFLIGCILYAAWFVYEYFLSPDRPLNETYTQTWPDLISSLAYGCGRLMIMLGIFFTALHVKREKRKTSTKEK